MIPPEAHSTFIYDVIGVGFGPANLAVAGALLEQPREVKHHESMIHCTGEFISPPDLLNISRKDPLH